MNFDWGISIYLSICKRWGPDGLTLSAYAWKVKNTFWLNRIDGAFLFFFGQHNHCQAQWQRETRGDLWLS